MRTYEILFFTRPDIEEEKLSEILTKYQEVIQKAGGAIKSADKWGRRRLAYEIDDLKEGLYVLMTFDGPGTLPREIDRMMGIDQDIIRHMISRIDGLKRQPKPAKSLSLPQGATQVQKDEESAPLVVEKEPELSHELSKAGMSAEPQPKEAEAVDEPETTHEENPE